MTYRKIGGIHWISLGRLRISFCVCRSATKLVSAAPRTSPIKPVWVQPRLPHIPEGPML